jgi:hypothetical protein
MSKYFYLLLITAAIVLVVIYRNRLTAFFTGSGTATATPPAPANNNTPAPTQLNYDKLLRKGSTGPEVKQLQYLLAIPTDGIFGDETEGALQYRKGVTEVTLNQFSDLPDTEDSQEDALNWWNDYWF